MFGGAMLLVVGAMLVTGLWGEFIVCMRGPIGGFTPAL